MASKLLPSKHEPQVSTSEPVSVAAFEQTSLSAEKAGTASDRRDMHRMGKLQELKRNFTFPSIFAFAAVLMITWEGTFPAVTYAIGNGGLPTMVWMYIVVFVGLGAAILVMAEMASMAPTSGGQYHWVSEFSPRAYQKFLSYIVGWFCVLGWQVGIAAQSFTVALQIQGLIILNNPHSYVPQAWHAVLITIAVALLAVFFNTVLARHLPKIELVLLVLHVAGFIAILVPLWALAPRHSNAQVWTNFQVSSGWKSVGTAALVGSTGPLYALLGPDAAVHMAEEVRDASLAIPLAMLWTLILNGLTGFIMIVTFAYTLGPVAAAVEPAYNFAFIGAFYYATQSRAGATVMTSIIIILTLCSAISNLATSSRQLFAFARDNGLPFSNVWRYVHPKWDLPINAILFSSLITSLLSLINLGSDVAFAAILSIGIGALLSSYMVSLSCILLKRIRGEEFLPRRWSLGNGLGWFCNILGLAYLVVAFVFTFFPLGIPVTLENMNWASAVYGGVAILAMSYYFLYGRRTYTPPVATLAKDL